LEGRARRTLRRQWPWRRRDRGVRSRVPRRALLALAGISSFEPEGRKPDGTLRIQVTARGIRTPFCIHTRPLNLTARSRNRSARRSTTSCPAGSWWP
jgi:hypothetical protein